MRFLKYSVLSLVLVTTACYSPIKYGEQDEASGSLIDRVNQVSTLRKNGSYVQVASKLLADLQSARYLGYGDYRLKNELADLYANQLLDIEKAIELDENIIRSQNANANSNLFVPVALVANQRILSDSEYYKSYIQISSEEIRNLAEKRLVNNKQLLQGKISRLNTEHTVSYLENHRRTVLDDLESTPINSASRFTVLSRLIRAEYELIKKNLKYKTTAFENVLKDSLPLGKIDLTEITFLQLADYFVASYKSSGDIRLAELALDTIYKPYLNLRNPENRWRYNKLINEYITLLIDENFKARRFDEAFYYISLNKSRMLLEERLAFSRSKGENGKISDLAINDGIPRTAYGLPEKSWFKQQLALTPQFLDFYVGGAYKPVTVASAGKGSRGASSIMPLNSRNAGLLVTNEPIDSFQDDALYTTKVEGGRVVSVIKLTGTQLTSLKTQMEKSYDNISDVKDAKAVPDLQKVVSKSNSKDALLVSSDKWMTKHPMDFHLGSRVIRSVNFFTADPATKLSKLNVAGFFNPSLAGGVGSLAGADLEARKIKAILPSAKIVQHANATIDALQQAESANVIHLSMHGQFNPDDATQSKLFFAGAKFDGSVGDSKALYAADMSKVAALSNRDLIFAAACQTGLSAADRSNENELIGILRPLTANRNRNVILSLWSVSDEVTGEFVDAFYQKLAATQEITTSFHFAQDQIKAKHPHPFYWAAFYLSQAK